MTRYHSIVSGLALLLAIVLLTGCTESDGSESTITVTSGSVVELYPVVNQSATVEFLSPGSWKASVSADWLTCSPQKGEAGSNTITLTTASTNRTKSTRTGQLTITSGNVRKSVTVIQSGKYAIFDQKEYTVPAEGGTLVLSFKSNLEESDNLQIAYSKFDWIDWARLSRFSRSEWSLSTTDIVVQPNTSESDRTAAFCLALPISGGSDWIALDTTFVHQFGVTDDYESVDYSSDGVVTVLQQSTLGDGIPIVLMGDGFADRDIADSTYFRVMNKALENLFSEEPVKSLRDYFDVYAVTAVSRNGRVGSQYSTVFSTVPSINSSSIDVDEETVWKYVEHVGHIDMDRTLAIVIVNSSAHNGITYLYSDPNGTPAQYSLSLCPVIEDLESETFRQVLTHEAVGHGLAKLADEYSMDTNGGATSTAISQVKYCHKYNWMMNVDVTDDKNSVLWSQFIGDSHFTSEHIDVYEGGFTYATGIYRSTEESMMRSNNSPFNAPSRKAIYDRVLLLGEGKPASTFDEFAAFDEQHKPEHWNYATTRSPHASQPRHFAPPVIKRASR